MSSQAYTQWQRTFLRAVRAPMDVTNGLLLQLYGAIQAENAALVTHRDKVAAGLEVSRRLMAVSEALWRRLWEEQVRLRRGRFPLPVTWDTGGSGRGGVLWLFEGVSKNSKKRCCPVLLLLRLWYKVWQTLCSCGVSRSAALVARATTGAPTPTASQRPRTGSTPQLTSATPPAGCGQRD